MLDLAGLPDIQSASVATPRAPTRLRAMLFAAGHEYRQPPERYDWDGRRRGDAEFGLIQLTLEGTGRLEFEGVTHTLRPGDAMVLWFPHDHRYWRPTHASWRFLYACVQGGEATRLWRDAAQRRGPIWHLDERSALTNTLRDVCTGAIAGQIDDPYRCSAAAYRLALSVLEESTVGDANPAPSPRSKAIARSIRFAQSKHHRPIGVDDLAEASGMSRYHFSRVFRQSEGLSPGRYLRNLRVAAAVRRLQTTDETLERIAAKTGFSHASHLSRAVRDAYGTTPGSIRKRGMYAPPGPGKPPAKR
ncbi:MAG: AraC family transcriptional regulator [Planctomycetota bacterium]